MPRRAKSPARLTSQPAPGFRVITERDVDELHVAGRSSRPNLLRGFLNAKVYGALRADDQHLTHAGHHDRTPYRDASRYTSLFEPFGTVVSITTRHKVGLNKCWADPADMMCADSKTGRMFHCP